jgi:hypothetical protein
MTQRKPQFRRTAAQPELRQFRSVPEFAAILGIGINQAYQAVNQGEVPSVTIGGQKRISDEVIARMKRGEAA